MPSSTERQRRFMGAELNRERAGKKTKTGMGEKQLSEFAAKPLVKAINNFISKKMTTGKLFWIATGQAKKKGHKDFSYGTEGAAMRDEIARKLGKQYGIKIKQTYHKMAKAWTGADDQAQADMEALDKKYGSYDEYLKTHPENRYTKPSVEAFNAHRQKSINDTTSREVKEHTPDMPMNSGVWKDTDYTKRRAKQEENYPDLPRPKHKVKFNDYDPNNPPKGKKVSDKEKYGGFEKGDKGRAIGRFVGEKVGEFAGDKIGDIVGRTKLGQRINDFVVGKKNALEAKVNNTLEKADFGDTGRDKPPPPPPPNRDNWEKLQERSSYTKKLNKEGTESLTDSKFSFSKKEMPNIADQMGSPTSGKMVKQKIDNLCKSIENTIVHGGKK